MEEGALNKKSLALLKFIQAVPGYWALIVPRANECPGYSTYGIPSELQMSKLDKTKWRKRLFNLPRYHKT